MSTTISHIGTIDSISDGMLHVRITQSSACSSCKIASHCSSAESKEKIIDVRHHDTDAFHIGQTVNVMAAESVGMKAVVMAFVIPTIVLLATVIVVLQRTQKEWVAAVSGLVMLIPYCLLLLATRRQLERTLQFWVEPTE